MSSTSTCIQAENVHTVIGGLGLVENSDQPGVGTVTGLACYPLSVSYEGVMPYPAVSILRAPGLNPTGLMHLQGVASDFYFLINLADSESRHMLALTCGNAQKFRLVFGCEERSRGLTGLDMGQPFEEVLIRTADCRTTQGFDEWVHSAQELGHEVPGLLANQGLEFLVGRSGCRCAVPLLPTSRLGLSDRYRVR